MSLDYNQKIENGKKLVQAKLELSGLKIGKETSADVSAIINNALDAQKNLTEADKVLIANDLGTFYCVD